MARIVVRGRRRVERVVAELETCGICETSVFPDLEGLAGEIKDMWRKR